MVLILMMDPDQMSVSGSSSLVVACCGFSIDPRRPKIGKNRKYRSLKTLLDPGYFLGSKQLRNFVKGRNKALGI